MAKQSSLGTPQEVQAYANAIDRNTPELGAPALTNSFVYLNSQNVITTQQATIGELQVGTVDAPQLLPVGSDNTLIVADSTQPLGMKWTTQLSWDETNRNLIAAHSSTINGANCAVIGADNCNIINGSTSSIIFSGYQNTIDGSQNSSILGGTQQQIFSGSMSSAILYGNSNSVQGQFSCAGGHHASVMHDSCFVITDSTLQTTDNFQILFGATNGFGFYSGVMNLTTFPNNFLNFYADTGDNHAKLQFKDNAAVTHTIDLSAGSVTGFSSNSVLFIGSTGVISEDNSNFSWDDANKNFIGSTSSSIVGSMCAIVGGSTNSITSPGVSTTSAVIIGGFSHNIASGLNSAIVGGLFGSITSQGSVILGGTNNTVSADNSYALGSHSTAAHPTSYVFSDGSSGSGLTTTANNQYLIRSLGGFGFVSGPMTLTSFPDNFLNFYADTSDNHAKLQFKDNTGSVSTIDLSALIPINTYTPGPVATANITSFTAYTTWYKDFGDCVRVWGRVDVQTTLVATLTQLDLSLPIVGPSNFSNSYDCGGNASAYTTLDNNIGIIAVPSTQKARLSWITANTAPQALTFDFIYRKTT